MKSEKKIENLVIDPPPTIREGRVTSYHTSKVEDKFFQKYNTAIPINYLSRKIGGHN